MKTLDQQISVSTQLDPNAFETIKVAGFKQIICHRPDKEAPDQPDFAVIREAATALGLATAYIPIAQVLPDKVALEATGKALENGRKTIMYCASGIRSTIVWALLEAGKGSDIAALIERAAAAGYDLGRLRDFLLRHADSVISGTPGI